MSSTTHRRGERGQIIALVAFALVAMVAGVALVVEGGNAFAQQRITQNASDAAANAGAVVLAERLGGATRTDADVMNALTTSTTNNAIGTFVGTYTDINGASLSTAVGSGSIPTGTAGVQVSATRTFGTSFARAIGLNSFDATADATAVTGILDGVCPAEAGCGILPVTFPVLISTCAAPHTTTSLGVGPYTLVSADARTDANMSIVPLCTTGPGSVGWLDLGPGNLATEIVTPTNKAFALPTWLQTQTGNVNSVEDEINDNYADKVILIPMFDGTCRQIPTDNNGDGDNLDREDCPPGQEGTGNNSWYHIPKFTAFWLEGAYVQGNNTQDCNSFPGSPFVGGNGSVSCMKGWFVRFITAGPVSSGPLPPDDPGAIGIQLIR